MGLENSNHFRVSTSPTDHVIGENVTQIVFWGKIVSPVLIITVFARGGQRSVLLARQGRAGPVTDGQDSGERRSEQRTCVVLRQDTPTHREQGLCLMCQQDGTGFLKLFFPNIVSRRNFPFIGFIAKPGYHWIMNLVMI